MRIAVLAPLWKTIPPQGYGGTELIAGLHANELVREGHDVTLYACGGSRTNATLVEVIDQPMFDLVGGFRFNAIQPYDLMEIQLAFEAAKHGDFDIIQNHMGLHVAGLAGLSPVPMVTTNHSSVPPDFELLSRLASKNNYVSISNSQREMSPYLNYVATVYHGIDTATISYNLESGDYLLFFATISKDKGADRAIEIAKKTGIKLIMAGDIREQADFDELKSLIDGEQIVYVGEVTAEQKNNLMKNALAYIFPIRWSEAFGLTVVESLASGTPVIAFNNGSMAELVDDTTTGFLVETIDQAVEAVKNISAISRAECRRQAVERFDVSVMTKNYLKVYEELST